MPYIASGHRACFEGPVLEILDHLEGPGDINYVITRIVKTWWEHNPRYGRIAEITGLLENVKQEFYRRVAAPYEDKKIAENGDVY